MMSASRPIVCFSSIAFADEPIESIIPGLAKVGYDGIEISSGHLRGKGPTELAAIRRLADENRLRIAVISPFFRLTRDLPELLETSFSTAGRFVLVARALGGPHGPPMIRALVDAGAGSIGSAVATPEHWTRATHALRRITALDPSAVFVIETRRDTLADTPESTLQLLERVAAPNLRVNYRPCDGDPVPGWRLLRHSVRHVHLHVSHDGKSGSHLEDGGHRLSELLAALRADGYSGTLSVEYRHQGVTWDRAHSARAWLRTQGL